MANTHIADQETPGACAGWCPGCADDRAEATYRKLAPKCQTCGGTGVGHPAHYKCSGDCSDCGGSGVVREARQTPPKCATCAGTGHVGKPALDWGTAPKCSDCKGVGFILEAR